MVKRHFSLDESSRVPLYEQLVERAAMAVTVGRLMPGDHFPSTRTLAAELGINPNTAARAMRELERTGLVEARRGVGTVVTPGAPAAAKRLAGRLLEQRLQGIIEVGRRLDLDLGDVQAELAHRWTEVLKSPESSGVADAGADRRR